MGRRVELDPEALIGGRDDEPVSTGATRHAALEGVEPVDGDVGGLAPAVDRVAVRADAVDDEPVARAPVAELDSLAHTGGHLRAAARSRRVEVRLGVRAVGLVRLDGRGEESDVGRLGHRLVGEQAVEPRLVDLATHVVVVAEDAEEHGAVGGTTVEDHRRAFEGAAHAAQRDIAVGAPGRDHREQRIARVHRVADSPVGVDADAGAHRERQQRNAARRHGGRPVVGVDGQQLCGDGDALPFRFLGRQRLAALDAQAPADDAGARAFLGRRVIGCGDAVEADDGEVGPVVAVRDGARSAIVRTACQLSRRAADALRQLAMVLGARCLRDHCLAVPAHADVAAAQDPDVPVVVGEDVDLDAPSGHAVGERATTGHGAERVGVGHAAHGRRVGAHHGDAGGRARLDERDPRPWSPCAEPQRVDARLQQARHDVGVRCIVGQPAHLVGLAAVPRLEAVEAVQQHGRDGGAVARLVEPADRVQHAHRGLTRLEHAEAFDDRPVAHRRGHRRNVACRSAATTSGIDAGSGIVR